MHMRVGELNGWNWEVMHVETRMRLAAGQAECVLEQAVEEAGARPDALYRWAPGIPRRGKWVLR